MRTELFNLCLDHVNGTVSKHDKDNYELSNEGIRLELFKLMEIEPTDKWGIKEVRAFRKHREEVFALIEEVLDAYMPNFMRENVFFNEFAEFKNIDFGQEQGFYIEDESYFTVSRVSGFNWDTRREKFQSGQAITIPTRWYDIHFYAEFVDIMTGRLDFSKLIDKARRSFIKFYGDEVAANMFNVDTYLPAELRPSGAYSNTAIRTLASAVSDANNGADIVVAGIRSMCDYVVDGVKDAWVSDAMANEKNNTGILRTIDGYRIMVIPTRRQEGSFVLPKDGQNKLFILPVNEGTKPIKIVNEGGSLTRSVMTPQGNQDMTIEEQIQFKMGSGVVFGNIFATYEIAP